MKRKLLDKEVIYLESCKIMKQPKSKHFYALFILFIIIVFFGAIYVYSIVTGNILEDAAVINIREVAVHDRNTITMFLESNWKNQQRIGERLKRNSQELKTVSQINEYLGLEAYESTFDKVYLLMEDGSYYTDVTYRKGSEDADYYPWICSQILTVTKSSVMIRFL